MHRGTADGEDAQRILVVPVVQDAREQVGVRAHRNRLEEVALDARGGDVLACRLHRPGAVDERRLDVRRRFDDRREQDAATAADVDQAREAREVVGRDDVARLLLGAPGHRGLEGGLLLGVGREVVEERRAVRALERRPAVPDRVEQTGRAAVVDLPAGAQRARHRHEGLTDRREREAAVLLGDDVLEREPAQDPRQRAGVRVHGRGELGARPRAVRERLGEPELGRDVEQLRHDEAVHQTEELPARIDRPMIAYVLWAFIPVAVLVTITPGAAVLVWPARRYGLTLACRRRMPASQRS